ncbi:hypothetical protein BHE74_00021737 [Ensete ventricosum]|nr:hypothetical protein BHE74_00021737 [Ensete ventricosum]
MAERHVSGTIELTLAERHVSGMIELTMAERCALGTTELMMAERCTSGTTELMMAERCVLGTIELTMAERRILGTIKLTMLKGVHREHPPVCHTWPACASFGPHGSCVRRSALRPVVCYAHGFGDRWSWSFRADRGRGRRVGRLVSRGRHIRGYLPRRMPGREGTWRSPRCRGGGCGGVKSTLVAGPEGAQPKVEVIHTEALAKRPTGSLVLDQTAAGRPGKQVKIAVRKHKSHHGEGSSRRAAREREPEVSVEDSSPTYRRPKSMRDLCDMRVREDDEGYYILQMAD